MIVTFHTAEDTNKAIHNGLYISSKCCTTCKLLPEPYHCYKYHTINTQHITANCKEICDICNTCRGTHLSTGSDHMSKIKMGIVDFKGENTLISSKTTKARKWYVITINIDGAVLICEGIGGI